MLLYQSKKNYSNRSMDRDELDRQSARFRQISCCTLADSPSRSETGGSSGGSMKRMIDLVSDDDDVDEDELLGDIRHPPTPQTSSRSQAEQSQEPPSKQPVISGSSSPVVIPDKSHRTLGPCRMLNDDIVHFYMKHVLDKQAQTTRDRVHVFNSFFYQKFSKVYMQSLRKQVTPEAIEEIVRRWDKDVKIFDKDFLLIPVCESLHWLLVIVAFPGLVQPGEEQPVIRATNKKPAILLFDSLRFKYMSKFFGFIRGIFLKYRWKFERPDEAPRHFESNEMLVTRFARVPKQKNYYDCGIHMLYSYERFLKNPMTVYQRVMDHEDLSTSFETDTLRMRGDIKALLPEVIEL